MQPEQVGSAPDPVLKVRETEVREVIADHRKGSPLHESAALITALAWRGYGAARHLARCQPRQTSASVRARARIGKGMASGAIIGLRRTDRRRGDMVARLSRRHSASSASAILQAGLLGLLHAQAHDGPALHRLCRGSIAARAA